MQKGTQWGPETLLRTAYVLLSSCGDTLQGTVPSIHQNISPAHLRSELKCRYIFSGLGLKKCLVSFAQAVVAGDGLLACRRSALVESPSQQVKELLEEIGILCSIRNGKRLKSHSAALTYCLGYFAACQGSDLRCCKGLMGLHQPCCCSMYSSMFLVLCQGRPGLYSAMLYGYRDDHQGCRWFSPQSCW